MNIYLDTLTFDVTLVANETIQFPAFNVELYNLIIDNSLLDLQHNVLYIENQFMHGDSLELAHMIAQDVFAETGVIVQLIGSDADLNGQGFY